MKEFLESYFVMEHHNCPIKMPEAKRTKFTKITVPVGLLSSENGI